jgi:hypothetical protein
MKSSRSAKSSESAGALPRVVRWAGAVSAAAVLIPLSSCVQGRSTLEAIQQSMGKAPFVEAYVEYPGPENRWAGPATFRLHLTAKDLATPASITVSPALWRPHRSLASNALPGPAPAASEVTRVSDMSHLPTASGSISVEMARDELFRLGSALEGVDGNVPGLAGCLSPVHVRLTRSDGSVTEKRGCRSQAGWQRAVGESVNHWLSAWLQEPLPVAATGAAPTLNDVPVGAEAAQGVGSPQAPSSAIERAPASVQ